MMLTLTDALLAAEQLSRDSSTGQNDMFGGVLTGGGAWSPDSSRGPNGRKRSVSRARKETLGLYLTGHPITRFESELGKITSSRPLRAAVEPEADSDRRRTGRGTAHDQHPKWPHGDCDP